MKKLLVILLIVVLLCGCNDKQGGVEEDRFIVEYTQNNPNRILIIRDTQTGVAYLFIHEGYAGGLTRLVEVDNGS